MWFQNRRAKWRKQEKSQSSTTTVTTSPHSCRSVTAKTTLISSDNKPSASPMIPVVPPTLPPPMMSHAIMDNQQEGLAITAEAKRNYSIATLRQKAQQHTCNRLGIMAMFMTPYASNGSKNNYWQPDLNENDKIERIDNKT